VSSTFDLLFKRLEDSASDFGDDIKNALTDFFNPL
jgi:hypothetical protein